MRIYTAILILLTIYVAIHYLLAIYVAIPLLLLCCDTLLAMLRSTHCIASYLCCDTTCYGAILLAMVRVKMGWRLSLLFLAGITGCDSLSSLWRESLVVAGRAPPLRLLGVHHQLQLSLLPLACITGCAFLSSGGTVTLAERALPFV